ncbi:nickel transporter [Microlunatus elymi]|uniref:Nickel/cobalt efflux system n=1 Tax=Microlunatus elymi TaxID=2596828 RepID=A0A516PZ56_9ACTN|nr:nickel transporter [Microlunatus elymi]QDP96450.1 nickel transporter [Microlunatus elymi]
MTPQRTSTSPVAEPTTLRSLLTPAGREARPFRTRVTASYVVIGGLHLIGLTLLATTLLPGQGKVVTVPLAVLAYLRGLMHSFDFDHISMIDNSTRKFISEGRRPASVGLAFSTGHSTVVILTGVALVAGLGAVRHALDGESTAAQALGIIGLSVSGLYLLLVAISNLAAFITAWRLRLRLRRDPGLEVPPQALTPRGPAAMIMTAPLRRVRHPHHIYGIGFLFSLGFDTSSQIGLLMLTGAAGLAGAAPLATLSLPFLFAAAMTLGDTSNGLMMLKMYESAADDPARKINFNLLITGISICSALLVGTIAAATLLSEVFGVDFSPITAIASIDTSAAGYLLAAGFAVIGIVAALLWRRTRRAVS